MENIRQSLEARGLPIIREKSHQILMDLAKELNPKNILEIGTAVGFSGMSMLLSAKDAKLITLELNHDRVIEAKANFKKHGFSDRVEVIEGDCAMTLANMLESGNFNKYFDFVFLDGPKAQYVKLLDTLIDLTKSGGMILADNVLFRGFVRGDKTNMPKRFKTIVKRLEMFLEQVEMSDKISSYKLLDVEDGLLEIIVR